VGELSSLWLSLPVPSPAKRRGL